MKTFKHERDWKDLERADKIVLFVGVLLWAALETGCLYQAMHAHQKQSHMGTVFKTIVFQR